MTLPCFDAARRLAPLLIALLALPACSTKLENLLPDRRPDYRKSQVRQNNLEVPPDLTASTVDDTLLTPELSPASSASLSTYAGERGAQPQAPAARQDQAVLPIQAGITMEQDGQQRWLVVTAPADQVWSRVREFWTSNGFALKRDDPAIGILETDWMENRADIPEDGIRRVLKQFLDFAYSAPTRDRFRTRLERAADGQHTEVYLTHSGVEEVAVGGATASASNAYVWQRRPSNPELEAEMLKRLAVYLGASEQRAEARRATTGQAAAGPRTQLTEVGGESRLLISEDYSRSWRLVGLALDSSNYAVEEQNRGQGLYLVEYRDPELENRKPGDEGWLAKLAFWRDRSGAPPAGTRYQVRLAGQGAQTVVVVRDASGQPDASAGARQLLEALQRVIR